MKNSKLSLLIIGLVSVTTYVNAQNSDQQRKGGKHPSVEEVFSQMDNDQDNLLSESEVQGPLKNDFSTIDTNSDGFISMEELNDAPKPKRNRGQRPNRQD